MHLHLITAEDSLTLQARTRELIRFPQLTLIQNGGWNKWWATKGAIIATRVVHTDAIIPRNLGYMFGVTGETRLCAAMHAVDNHPKK